MIQIDLGYIFLVCMGLACICCAVLGIFVEARDAKIGASADPIRGAWTILVLVFLAGAFLAAAAYHSGQTYHPCTKDPTTAKQTCR